MKGSLPVFGALAVGCLALAGAAAAEMEVVISRPEPGFPVFGKVDVRVEIYPPSANVDRVEVFLDDVYQDTASGSPPFVIPIDAGEDNRAHEILAVAYDSDGNSFTATLQTPPIRVDDEFKVELQQLYVTVEADDQTLPVLTRDDFQIYDREARQEIVTFERGEVPFTAVLLVDSSRSMRGEPLQTALRGARAFVEGMRELDEAKLLLFSDRILYETPFTSFSSVLSVGLSQVEAAGGTALNDFLYLGIERVQQRQGRRVVVLLSDGIDVTSVLLMEQVREAIRMNQASIYWIVPPLGGGGGAGHRSFWRDPDEHRRERELLERTVIESGGRIVELESLEQTPQAFETVLDELRSQYVLGYYPPVTGRSGTYHRTEVKVRVPRLKIRSRIGYYERPRQAESDEGRTP